MTDLNRDAVERPVPDKDREIERLNKIIRALMNRAEHTSSLQGSAFNLFETAVMLEEQVRRRTEELEAALAENEKITRALQQAKEKLEAEILQRVQAQRELEVANDQLASLNITDALTGLTNRRGLDEMLALKWQSAAAGGQLLGVAMIDIDKFKLYNDHYGHLEGDDCLRRVAEALRQSVRLGDLVARYGGEEVAMVLPGADSRTAEQIAERARAAVEALGIEHAQAPTGVVTVSIGVATTVPTARMQPAALLEAADEALYRAKSEGRNCVRVALG